LELILVVWSFGRFAPSPLRPLTSLFLYHPKMLSRLRQLPKPERQDLLPAFWRLLVARTALFFGIRRAAGWLSGSKKRETELDLILWQRRALALKRVGGRIPGVACLTRALALRSWMRRQGLPAQMIIGVATAQNTPDTHAWVETNGQPIDETPTNIQRFREIQRL